MKGTIIGLAAIAAVLGGAGVFAYDHMIGSAKRAVSERFDDPYSTQFKNIRLVQGGVCGSVNAKNRMGAYVGYEDFYARRIAGIYLVRFRRGGLPGHGQEYAEACTR